LIRNTGEALVHLLEPLIHPREALIYLAKPLVNLLEPLIHLLEPLIHLLEPLIYLVEPHFDIRAEVAKLIAKLAHLSQNGSGLLFGRKGFDESTKGPRLQTRTPLQHFR
jgi:hypothetical protein